MQMLVMENVINITCRTIIKMSGHREDIFQ